MKKTFAVLMLATMLFSVGCGNQAKEAAQDAQKKVEQTAEEAKDAASKAADEAASKVEEAKDAASQAADEAASKVEEVKKDADQMMSDAVDKVDAMAGEIGGRTIALSGVMPGASLEDLTAMFGEATAVDGKVMTFVDGLKVTLNDADKVKEISTTSNAFDTPAGIYVGADEYLLNDYCGPADATRQISNGAEYEYNSDDKKSKVVYKSQNGVITEITCSLND